MRAAAEVPLLSWPPSGGGVVGVVIAVLREGSLPGHGPTSLRTARSGRILEPVGLTHKADELSEHDMRGGLGEFEPENCGQAEPSVPGKRRVFSHHFFLASSVGRLGTRPDISAKDRHSYQSLAGGSDRINWAAFLVIW